MKLIVNNSIGDYSENPTVRELLQSAKVQSEKGIAVAVNNKVIPRESWAQFQFAENDNVLVIQATKGG